MPDIVIPINKTVDISQGCLLTTLGLLNTQNQLIQGQSYAHQLNVSVNNAGTPVELSGVCTAYFVRQSDSSTVTVAGTISGNVASVSFPSMVYDYTGLMTITLFVGGAAIIQIETSVRLSGTMAIVDPGHILPNLDEIQQIMLEVEQGLSQIASSISAAETATNQANNAAGTANAAAAAVNNAIVSTVNTLDAGENATASITLQDGVWNLAFGIPRGLNGAAGGTGNTVTITAADLANTSISDLQNMYTNGTRILQVTNSNTVVLLSLNADGSTAFQSSTEPTRNLLDNPDFSNPVNQRGASSYTSNVYGIDRWVGGATNVNITITSKWLTFANTGAYNLLVQRFVQGTFTGKMLTLAACDTNGNWYVGSGIFPDPGNALALFTASNGFALSFDARNGTDDVRIGLSDTATSSVQIMSVVLLEGSYTSQTLPLWEAPNITVETLKCQYFAQVLSSNSVNVIDLRPTMRLASPTITQLSSGKYLYSCDL